MSHQISGARSGIANEDLDRYFLRNLPDRLDDLAAIPVRERMRFSGTEAVELTLWFAMRAALSRHATPVYTLQAFPAITGCRALVMAGPGEFPETEAGAGAEDQALTANLEGEVFTATTSSREEKLGMPSSVPPKLTRKFYATCKLFATGKESAPDAHLICIRRIIYMLSRSPGASGSAPTRDMGLALFTA